MTIARHRTRHIVEFCLYEVSRMGDSIEQKADERGRGLALEGQWGNEKGVTASGYGVSSGDDKMFDIRYW